MVKMSFTNNQTAFEYALYMIAASYFDKAVCTSVFSEKNMLLQYKEQKLDKQYQMEDICIRFMDKVAEELPEKIFKQNMQVRLGKREGAPTQIRFENDQYILCFTGNYAGRKSQIDYRILPKKVIDKGVPTCYDYLPL